ncbi:M48 family metallopeptidase [Xanthomonas sacchari]|uniref:M48 family metallopeptidase n=1 Tax=Xanthomonas sacchari TaxID=56458 RepID=UPI0035281334
MNPPAVTTMQVRYGERIIACQIRRSPQRRTCSVAIHIDADGTVRLDAPQQASDADIRHALQRRAGWVHRHLQAIEARRRLLLPRQYVSGETVLYLGRRYRLKVQIGTQGEATALRGGYLEVTVPTRSAQAVRATLDHWLRQRAKDIFQQRLAATAEPLRWVKHTPALTVRRMQRRWGSCSASGRITLNAGLIHASRECIDYVILHELCHLQAHQHGRAFQRLLDAHLPDWRALKQRLDGMAELVMQR